MKWDIPAKTFLVGEYVALVGGPAVILTTTPSFEVTLTETIGLQGIHPESPAGCWWMKKNFKQVGLKWYDPYQGVGGMGASSAQFIGAYAASAYLEKKSMLPKELLLSPPLPGNGEKVPEGRMRGSRQKRSFPMLAHKGWVAQDELLNAYLQSAWQGHGLPPSGYDVIAQSMGGCVYINRAAQIYQSYDWPFLDLGFILLHTGKKVATHEHLQSLKQLNGIDSLCRSAENTHEAFIHACGERLISSIEAYYQQLLKMKLVATHTIEMVECLNQQTDVLAAKGCGAFGADVILVIVHQSSLNRYIQQANESGCRVIGSSLNIAAQKNKTTT